MITLELVTVAVRKDGCFSVLKDQFGVPFAVTIEHTFADGKPIIGNGPYTCRKSFYNKGGYSTFEISVPGHTLVLFHRGNTEEDSRGCIIVAESFGELKGATAVLDSKGGFAEFMKKVEGYVEFQLMVSNRRWET